MGGEGRLPRQLENCISLHAKVSRGGMTDKFDKKGQTSQDKIPAHSGSANAILPALSHLANQDIDAPAPPPDSGPDSIAFGARTTIARQTPQPGAALPNLRPGASPAEAAQVAAILALRDAGLINALPQTMGEMTAGEAVPTIGTSAANEIAPIAAPAEIEAEAPGDAQAGIEQTKTKIEEHGETEDHIDTDAHSETDARSETEARDDSHTSGDANASPVPASHSPTPAPPPSAPPALADTPRGGLQDAPVEAKKPRERWLATGWDWAALIVLIAVAGIAGATFRQYGMGWDDYTHSEYGELLVALFASTFKDQRAFEFVNLYYYGGAFDLGAALLAKVLPFSLFDTRRLAGAIAGLLTLLITWRLGRRVSGPSGGFFALVILAACPLFYGHMFMNPKDIPFALAMTLMLLGFVRLFEDYPNSSGGTILTMGTGAGLAVGTRVMAGFGMVEALVAFFPLLLGELRGHGFVRAIGRFLRALIWLIPAIILALIVMALVWPWSAQAPGNLFRAIAYFDTFFEQPWPELFDGKVLLVPDMPWTYLPILLGFQLPEPMLALNALGFIGVLVALLRTSVAAKRKTLLLLILLAALLPIAVAMITHPALYNGLRHFLFVLPPLAVLAALAAAWILEWLRARHVVLMVIAALAVLAAFVPQIIDMTKLHPFQYAYFNRASGGMKAAQGRFMIDYWGLSFRQSSEALRDVLKARGEARPLGRKWKVAVCGPTRAAQVFLGPDFEAGSETANADFAMTLNEFYCRKLDLPETLQIAREGVTFARVYDIRGLKISTLDTTPPVRAPK
jgi:hypothetical protein